MRVTSSKDPILPTRCLARIVIIEDTKEDEKITRFSMKRSQIDLAARQA
jgi:hypothetical protein